MPDSLELVLVHVPHSSQFASWKRLPALAQGLPVVSVDFLETIEVDGLRLDQDLPSRRYHPVQDWFVCKLDYLVW